MSETKPEEAWPEAKPATRAEKHKDKPDVPCRTISSVQHNAALQTLARAHQIDAPTNNPNLQVLREQSKSPAQTSLHVDSFLRHLQLMFMNFTQDIEKKLEDLHQDMKSHSHLFKNDVDQHLYLYNCTMSFDVRLHGFNQSLEMLLSHFRKGFLSKVVQSESSSSVIAETKTPELIMKFTDDAGRELGQTPDCIFIKAQPGKETDKIKQQTQAIDEKEIAVFPWINKTLVKFQEDIQIYGAEFAKKATFNGQTVTVLSTSTKEKRAVSDFLKVGQGLTWDKYQKDGKFTLNMVQVQDMMEASHPNIIRVFGLVRPNDEGTTQGIIIENMTDEASKTHLDLRDCLSLFQANKKAAFDVAVQLCDAMAFVYAKQWAYGNLRSNSIVCCKQSNKYAVKPFDFQFMQDEVTVSESSNVCLFGLILIELFSNHEIELPRKMNKESFEKFVEGGAVSAISRKFEIRPLVLDCVRGKVKTFVEAKSRLLEKAHNFE